MPDHEIHNMVVDRERARFRNDFAAADRIRDTLFGMGVTIDDKQHRWRSRDGRTGRRPDADDWKWYPDVAAPAVMQNSGLAVPDEVHPDMHSGTCAPAAGGTGCAWSSSSTGAWQQAPWKALPAASGFSASAQSSGAAAAGAGDWAKPIAPAKAAPTPTHVIHNLLLDREYARFAGGFVEADRIRDKLRGLGVQVNDTAHTWRSRHVRSGIRPCVSDVVLLSGEAPRRPAPQEAGPPAAAEDGIAAGCMSFAAAAGDEDPWRFFRGGADD